MIGVPKLPLGNLASVLRMVEKCGGDVELLESPKDLGRCDKVILAGVGSFDYGVGSLRDGRWIDPLNDAALERRLPVLGICLGMQLMCSRSEEGELPGLGWMNADVKRFRPPAGSSLKVPHMGWNTVAVSKPNPLIPRLVDEQRYYFVHSYYVACRRDEEVLAVANHGHDFVAAFSRGNVFGVQFHPEKSHRFGMALVKSFIGLQC